MGKVKIIHNKLLGGWYVVSGPHHFPLGGRFASKAEAKAWLERRRNRPLERLRYHVSGASGVIIFMHHLSV